MTKHSQVWQVPHFFKNLDLFIHTVKTAITNPSGLLQELKLNLPKITVTVISALFLPTPVYKPESAFISSSPFVLRTQPPPYVSYYCSIPQVFRSFPFSPFFISQFTAVRMLTDFYDLSNCMIMFSLWSFLILFQSSHQIWLLCTEKPDLIALSSFSLLEKDFLLLSLLWLGFEIAWSYFTCINVFPGGI